MNKITDHLWIGDIIDAVFLEDFPTEFDRVVSLVPDEKAKGIRGTVDQTTHQHDIVDGENVQIEFNAAVYDVWEGIEREETTFVHCHAGVSRAAAVSIAALALYESWPYTHVDDPHHTAELAYDAAYNTVKDGRPIIDPAPELREHALDLLEKHIRYRPA